VTGRSSHRRSRPQRGGVLLQTNDQWPGGRHQTVLAELGVVDVQHALDQVNVPHAQAQCLFETKAASVQHAQQLWQDDVAQVCRRHRLDPVRGVEQAADFLVRQHARQERLRLLGAAP
jgi:hypothetical protein